MAGTQNRPPTARTGLIERSRLLEHLRDTSEPVVSVAAPAGYGKTTSMSQYHRTVETPTGWLSLDESDSDPVVLLDDLTKALQQADLVADSEERGYQSDAVLTRGIRSLAERIETDNGGILFIDQVDHLHSQSSLDVVGAVMTRIAGPLQVVIASRAGTGLPLGLLRSQGVLAEFGADSLAMDEGEAAQVFASMGITGSIDIDGILRKTEGWPAGIYLMALASQMGVLDPADVDIGGDDVFFADYLREEVLRFAPPEMRDFLLKSSLMPRLSGPLCDYVFETSGSHQMLSTLEQSNLLVVPTDRTRTWFRYHSLMRDYLKAEMRRVGAAEEISVIHARAATWFDDNGFGELAIGEAKESRDLGQFVQLFAKNARRVGSQGRLNTLIGWVDWLEGVDALNQFGEFAALAAYVRSLEGSPGSAEQMSRYAYFDEMGRPRPDDELGPLALTVRSMQFLKGPDQAVADARRAVETSAPDSQWSHLAGIAEALAVVAASGLEDSERCWLQSEERCRAVGAIPTVALSLAERGLLAIQRDDWATAAEMSDRALTEIGSIDFSGYISNGLVFALASRCAARSGDLDSAKSLLASASQVRPRMSSAFPAISVQSLNEMTKALVELGDISGARRVARDAADIIAVRPNLGTLVEDHESLRERLAEMPAGDVGASSLTRAEMRLLPMLVTHLSYPEIGARLYISRHTVKTQATSIYRKLAVSSRADAVERARELGLITL